MVPIRKQEEELKKQEIKETYNISEGDSENENFYKGKWSENPYKTNEKTLHNEGIQQLKIISFIKKFYK